MKSRKLQLRTNPYKGKLLVFEGTDGAGKTTLISMTEHYIEGKHGIGTVLSLYVMLRHGNQRRFS